MIDSPGMRAAQQISISLKEGFTFEFAGQRYEPFVATIDFDFAGYGDGRIRLDVLLVPVKEEAE